ncbi:MAG: hypothetical protein IJ710_04190 [Prevotella sp.]|nr:hypothetical protein [Prevotella sp.]
MPEYSNGIYFEGVAVTYTPVGGKTTLTGSWSDAAPSFTIGDDANSSLPTFSVTGGATLDTDYTVAYTLVSGTLATVDASTGITAINTSATGTATVRATVALTATGEESYTLSTTTYDCVITVEDVPTLTAVTSKTWDFSTWTKEKYTTTQIIDNLEIVATSAKNIEVDGNSKTFEGVSYTQRIKLGGSGAPDDRCLHFKVNGPSLISVYGMSGKTGEDRPLGITVNETEEQTTFSGDEVRKAVYIYKETGTGVDVYVYSKSSGINIYGIKVEPLRSITLNSSGYATFSYEKPVQLISDDATAYTAALDFGAGTIDCTAIEDNKVPAGNGVLLYGGNGATVYISEIASAPALSSNNLHGTTDASGNLVDKGANTYYVLSGSTFKKYTGTVFAANKAYFEVAGSAVQAPERFTIQFNDDVVTGIQNVTGDSQPRVRKYLKDGRLVIENANGVFTLSGARVK